MVTNLFYFKSENNTTFCHIPKFIFLLKTSFLSQRLHATQAKPWWKTQQTIHLMGKSPGKELKRTNSHYGCLCFQIIFIFLYYMKSQCQVKRQAINYVWKQLYRCPNLPPLFPICLLVPVFQNYMHYLVTYKSTKTQQILHLPYTLSKFSPLHAYFRKHKWLYIKMTFTHQFLLLIFLPWKIFSLLTQLCL